MMSMSSIAVANIYTDTITSTYCHYYYHYQLTANDSTYIYFYPQDTVCPTQCLTFHVPVSALKISTHGSSFRLHTLQYDDTDGASADCHIISAVLTSYHTHILSYRTTYIVSYHTHRIISFHIIIPYHEPEERKTSEDRSHRLRP